MTLFLELNIGLTKQVIFLLSSPQYVTYMNDNTRRIEKYLKIVLLKWHYYIQLKRYLSWQLKWHSVIGCNKKPSLAYTLIFKISLKLLK